MFERFTEKARTALLAAQARAAGGEADITTDLLLLGVLDARGVGSRALEGAGLTADRLQAVHGLPDEHTASGVRATVALASIGIDLEEVRRRAEATFGADAIAAPSNVPFTIEAKDALELALLHALTWGHNYIGTEHLAVGAIHSSDARASVAAKQLGVGYEQLAEVTLLTLLSDGVVDSSIEPLSALRAFAADRPDLDIASFDRQLAQDIAELAATSIAAHLDGVARAAAAAAEAMGFDAPPPPGGTAARTGGWFRRSLSALTTEERTARRDRFDDLTSALTEARADLIRTTGRQRNELLEERVSALISDARRLGWDGSS